MVNQITFLSALVGGLPFLLLLPVFAYHAYNRSLPRIFLIGMVVSVLWHLLIALSGQAVTLVHWQLQAAEVLRYGVWMTALLYLLEDSTGRQLARLPKYGVMLTWMTSLVVHMFIWAIDSPIVQEPRFAIYNNLLLCILGLFVTEQLFRNADQQRLPRLMAVTLGALFAYDAFLLTNLLVFRSVAVELWQARSLVSGVTALFLLAGSLSLTGYRPRRTRFSISRPIAFSTTSIMLAGIFLLFMSLTGYYVNLTGGQWGGVLQAVILFVALLVITLVFSSRTMRARLYVQVNKHFFQHKYDYRGEWRKLNDALATPVEGEEYLQVAMDAAASIFHSRGAVIYLRDTVRCSPASTFNMDLPHTDMSVRLDSAFCRLMEDQVWIWFPSYAGSEELDKYNELIPDSIGSLPRLFMILPLVSNKRLQGFILLDEPKRTSTAHQTNVSWEDLDLMRMVSHEIANYVSSQRAVEQLLEARLFDMYNRLSAFVMHDLKNLIAQQALVVKNAGVHKDNPEFILDAIGTIDSSVTRMNKLLAKLQEKSFRLGDEGGIRSVRVADALHEALGHCQGDLPVPELIGDESDVAVSADPENLVMVFTHIIRNAQEATPAEKEVSITLQRQQDFAVINIVDHGEGMDAEFVRTELFKPFRSTKNNKGMGIGAHQCKFLVESMGGYIDVDSTPGKGTSMMIRLPRERLNKSD